MQQLMRLSAHLSNRVLLIIMLEHQGVLNLAINNYQGAIRAFQRMRDVAEECQNREYEMKAYMHLGITLQEQQNYR